MTKDDLKTESEAATRREASVVERIVMWLDEKRRVRNAKRLYKRLWKANDIILFESHGYYKNENKDFKKELVKCNDAIEMCIVKVRDSYET